MNQCESILQEIYRTLSPIVPEKRFSGTDYPGDLLQRIRVWLEADPTPAAIRLARSARLQKGGRVHSASVAGQRLVAAIQIELERLLARAEHDGPAPIISRSRPVRYVKGVGERVASLLAKLDIHDEQDLIYFFPYRYEDRQNLLPISQLRENAFVTIQGTVKNVDLQTTRRVGFNIFQLLVEDASGTVVAKWFNQSYLKKIFRPGQRLILSGRVRRDPYSFSLDMDKPEYEILSNDGEETIHTNRIVPIYHTTAGLTQRRLRTIMFQYVESHRVKIEEFLPPSILDKYRLPLRAETISQLHFPESSVPVHLLNAFRSPYHKRFIFEEFLLLEMLLAMHKGSRTNKVRGTAFKAASKLATTLVDRLPYRLTAAQERVIGEIRKDMARPIQMSRLLQGDVGCGKTTVAAVAAAIAMDNHFQVAVMAPTEILAEQLYLNFHRFFDSLKRRTALLSKGVQGRERARIHDEIRQGRVHVVVGTQALIQKEVAFHRLGLVIIDEQHRFGVVQRATLSKKGAAPHVLVMTATPIPRSLSLTVYGDLDISVIDAIPAGRSPVQTEIVRAKDRKKLYSRIKSEIRAGRQAFIVYPLVAETEKSDLAAATEMSGHLAREVFPDRCVGLLHGRVKPEEKETIMTAFKNREIDVLVCTTVVEVGIDIPNATVMVIEHAERFGLAQLHQLRGRVGRGSHRSFCYLMVAGRVTDEAKRRLAVMERTNDGFKIAEEDLSIRGPGEFFGKKQSGMPNLILGNIVRDLHILEVARKEAFGRIKADPSMKKGENQRLLQEMEERYGGRVGLVRVG
ncbi:MAG: ATP-dependent DNA helicase RecG [bacterium]|nr:ATP-dependent DNA helicase RecG [bacterium]